MNIEQEQDFNKFVIDKFAQGTPEDQWLDTIVDWCCIHLDPEDIFDDMQLGKWATRNQYKLEDEK